MNWADLVVLLILLAFTLEGFVIGFFVALSSYNFLARILDSRSSLPHSLTNVLGFILIWYLVELGFLLFYLSSWKFFKKPRVFPAEKYFSLIPAFLKGLVFLSIILVLVATFPAQSTVKQDIVNSKTASLILSQTNHLESPIKKIFGEFENETLTFLTIKPESNETVNLGFKTKDFNFDEQTEKRMMDLVNQERTSRGLPVLIYDSRLQDVAQKHSADMFERGYFSHYSPEGKNVADRVNQEKVDYLVVGENLAYAPSLEIAHQGLMNSHGHRANILSKDYHKMGIGVAVSQSYGMMLTQVFTN
jgi:uncharacterized protein YkwD